MHTPLWLAPSWVDQSFYHRSPKLVVAKEDCLLYTRPSSRSKSDAAWVGDVFMTDGRPITRHGIVFQPVDGPRGRAYVARRDIVEASQEDLHIDVPVYEIGRRGTRRKRPRTKTPRAANAMRWSARRHRRLSLTELADYLSLWLRVCAVWPSLFFARNLAIIQAMFAEDAEPCDDTSVEAKGGDVAETEWSLSGVEHGLEKKGMCIA